MILYYKSVRYKLGIKERLIVNKHIHSYIRTVKSINTIISFQSDWKEAVKDPEEVPWVR